MRAARPTRSRSARQRPKRTGQHRLLGTGVMALCTVALVVGSILALKSWQSSETRSEHGSTPKPIRSEEFMYGVTIDRIDEPNTTLKALRRLPERPTARLIFDEHIPPSVYTETVTRLSLASNIMGELLDSYYVKEYPLSAYQNRTEEYVGAFADKIAIWEVGNEVNGEWLLNKNEPRSAVVDKIAAAYDIVRRHRGKTAITFYYNQGCWEKPEHEMFRWIRSEMPAHIKQGLDYAFISYYEEECNNLRPDWQEVFEQLREEFPNAKLGFGEVGVDEEAPLAKKLEYLRRYYTTLPDVNGFVGGYFWWYFWPDMVKPLLSDDTTMLDALSEVMQQNSR